MPSKLSSAPLSYTFDDFTLAPVYSQVKSRKQPSTSTFVIPNYELEVPIFSAPMNTVTGPDMVIKMVSLGASAVLHRYMSLEELKVSLVKILKECDPNSFFVAVGATGDFLERVDIARSLGVFNFCVDVANGHSEICLEAVRSISVLMNGKGSIMGGNVCTADGVTNLCEAGATVMRTGIGPGSVCSTRVVTGHGVPQLTSIEECVSAADAYGVSVIADGGIRGSGDVVKALAIGASAVMIGGLLAGTDETPGEVVDGPLLGWESSKDFLGANANFQKVKKYAGMASEDGRRLNGWESGAKASFAPEGVSTYVPYKGPTENVIAGLVDGLKVGMSFSNAYDLADLWKNAQWRRVTENGRLEGTPHGKR